MEIMNFIPEHLLILIAAAYVFAAFLKQLESFKDKYITIVLMVFCVTLAFLLNIINMKYKTMLDAAVNAVLQGILCWGASIGINQTYKQLTKQE